MYEKAGVGLSFAIFRKIFPTKERAYLSPAEIEALGKVYRKWEFIALPFVFGYIAGCAFLIYLVLGFFGDLSARSHPPCLFLVVPDRLFWGLPALFLGIIFAAVPMHFTYTILLGKKRYEEYTLWTNLRTGFDGWKAFQWLAFFVLGLSGLAVAGGFRFWDAYHEDRVVFMRPWYWNTQTYPYSRVQSIARVARSQAPNGNLVNNPYKAIRFDDGFIWKSHDHLNPLDEDRDAAILDIVSSRSGQPIQQIDLIVEMKP